MSIGTRLAKIERQLGIELTIKRKVLVVFGAAPQTEAQRAEQRAEIDRRIREAIERDPTKTFHLIWMTGGPFDDL